MKKKCPKCGMVVETEDRYCFEDGAEYIERPKCQKCNSVLEFYDKFCGKCGTKVKRRWW